MRAFRIFGRNIRDSFKSVFRNFSLSIASISCITITLIVVAISAILSFNVSNFASLVEKDVTIVAFLDVDITQEKKDTIETKIKALDNIESCVFQSKMEIMDQMMESSDTFKNIMAGWGEEDNPLQDTFLVKITDIDLIEKVAAEIKTMDGVNVVKYGEGMVEQLANIFDTVRKISFGVVFALIIVTAFLISNTIKITIISRRREIEIMRLVGASNINIKIPYILEGLFLGILGSIIPIVVTTYGYSALYHSFNWSSISPFLKLITPEPFVYLISLLLLVVGVLVGMFGSWWAVRKHLKI